jgi:hypothetical protein
MPLPTMPYEPGQVRSCFAFGGTPRRHSATDHFTGAVLGVRPHAERGAGGVDPRVQALLDELSQWGITVGSHDADAMGVPGLERMLALRKEFGPGAGPPLTAVGADAAGVRLMAEGAGVSPARRAYLLSLYNLPQADALQARRDRRLNRGR